MGGVSGAAFGFYDLGSCVSWGVVLGCGLNSVHGRLTVVEAGIDPLLVRLSQYTPKSSCMSIPWRDERCHRFNDEVRDVVR